MKKSIAVISLSLGAALSALPAFAQENFVIDSSHTFPSFEVSHLGFSIHRGRFNKTEGKVTLNTAAKSGSVEITIDANSIDTGGDKMDGHLRNEDFFNVAKFPTLAFKGSKMKFEGDKPVAIEGDFTMLGVTKPITLAINNFKCGTHPFNKKAVCGAEVAGTIKRSEWGMKYGVPGIGDDVKLLIQVEAFKS
ncbi:MAG: polyisoprenoid-binding protein [Betaproteobacteria bacterium]|nr:polyisoprenoid-binding protein [Betaproteobacteria bacterium]